jgi:phosphoribosylformylglycinamidine synthase
LRNLGYGTVQDVRQGKFFVIKLADGLGEETARQEVEKMARNVLTNPVIEEFTYVIE